MAIKDIYLYFNGEHVGLIQDQAGVSSTIGSSIISKQGSKAGEVGKTIITAVGPSKTTPQRLNVRIDHLLDTKDPIQIGNLFNEYVRKFKGKKGALDWRDGAGNTFRVSGNQLCTGLSWSGDIKDNNNIYIDFTFDGGDEMGMQFFDELKNGSFEAIDGSGEAVYWTRTGGNVNAVTTALLGTEGFGTGQFCMKLPCDSTAPGVDGGKINQSQESVASATGYEDTYLKLTVSCKLSDPTTDYNLTGKITLKINSDGGNVSTKEFIILNNTTTDYTIVYPVTNIYTSGLFEVEVQNTSEKGKDNEGDILIDSVTVEEVHEKNL